MCCYMCVMFCVLVCTREYECHVSCFGIEEAMQSQCSILAHQTGPRRTVVPEALRVEPRDHRFVGGVAGEKVVTDFRGAHEWCGDRCPSEICVKERKRERETESEREGCTHTHTHTHTNTQYTRLDPSTVHFI